MKLIKSHMHLPSSFLSYWHYYLIKSSTFGYKLDTLWIYFGDNLDTFYRFIYRKAFGEYYDNFSWNEKIIPDTDIQVYFPNDNYLKIKE